MQAAYSIIILYGFLLIVSAVVYFILWLYSKNKLYKILFFFWIFGVLCEFLGGLTSTQHWLIRFFTFTTHFGITSMLALFMTSLLNLKYPWKRYLYILLTGYVLSIIMFLLDFNKFAVAFAVIFGSAYPILEQSFLIYLKFYKQITLSFKGLLISGFISGLHLLTFPLAVFCLSENQMPMGYLIGIAVFFATYIFCTCTIIEFLTMENSSRMAALGEIAAGIAHEINNPLAIISLNMSLLNDAINNKVVDEDEKQKIFSINNSAISRIVKTINSLKEFAQIDENPIFVTVQVETIINNALSLCLEKLKMNNIELKIDNVNNPLIYCIPAKISQALVHLINNSVEALKNSDKKYIKISTYTTTKFVVISVIDTGYGVPEEIRSKLFKPIFLQNLGSKGIGLGLSIASSILKNPNPANST